jgi:hypothetical protein
MNWKGKPLISHKVIIQLIAATTTRKGLKVHVELDKTDYLKGVKVCDEEFAKIKLRSNEFHGDWNYTIDSSIA